MKLLVVIATAIAVGTASIIKAPVQGIEEGGRYFYFAGDDEQMHLIDSEEAVDDAFIRTYARNPANNAYYLFTRENPNTPQLLINYDEESLATSNFNPNKVTVFITHGWNGHGESSICTLIRDALLENDDVNIIVLDWSRLANRGYNTAKNGVGAVGVAMGNFVNWLHGFGLSYDNVHLVGFSLGGHLVGYAGRTTDGRVKRITALDPAGPRWDRDSGRLQPTDAQYVEAIHTSSVLGFNSPFVDADFFPNGGTGMPGCWISTCSHGRAYEYMASSIKYNHLLANRCDTERQMSRNKCTGELVPMGNNDINKQASGIFRVNTGKKYPY